MEETEPIGVFVQSSGEKYNGGTYAGESLEEIHWIVAMHSLLLENHDEIQCKEP